MRRAARASPCSSSACASGISTGSSKPGLAARIWSSRARRRFTAAPMSPSASASVPAQKARSLRVSGSSSKVTRASYARHCARACATSPSSTFQCSTEPNSSAWCNRDPMRSAGSMHCSPSRHARRHRPSSANASDRLPRTIMRPKTSPARSKAWAACCRSASRSAMSVLLKLSTLSALARPSSSPASRASAAERCAAAREAALRDRRVCANAITQWARPSPTVSPAASNKPCGALRRRPRRPRAAPRAAAPRPRTARQPPADRGCRRPAPG